MRPLRSSLDLKHYRTYYCGSSVKIKLIHSGFYCMLFIKSHYQNKHLVKAGIVIMLKTNVHEFEKSLADGRQSFLSQFYKKERMVYFRDVSDNTENSNMWNHLFSTKMHEEPSFKNMNSLYKIDQNV